MKASVKTKCPVKVIAKWETSPLGPGGSVRRPPGPVSSGWEGGGGLSFVSGRGGGLKSLNPGRARASEVSAFLDGGAVGVGRELGQAGLLGPGVVGEDRVLPGGAGGAAGVQVTLVQRHGQLQVLLEGERPLTSDPQTLSDPLSQPRGQPTHLVGRHGQTAVQILHQLLEGGSLGGDGLPAVPHHHVPETEPGVSPRIRNPPGSDPPGAILQLVGARGGLVHAVTFLQQLEQLLHGNAGIRGAAQGEDLPQQNPERPPGTQTHAGSDESGCHGDDGKTAWYSHVTLVGVDPIKERLGSHPLDRQAPLEDQRNSSASS